MATRSTSAGSERWRSRWVWPVIDVIATRAEYLVPTHVRGLQYLDTASMIQTGLIPLHPGAMDAYRALHG